MRSAVTVVVLGLAAVVVVVMGLVAYAITSEYGATPNDGGAGEAALGVLGGLPGAAVVGVLLLVGARRAPARRRALVAVTGALIALAAVAGGMLLGHLVLQQRCDAGLQSAACPSSAGRDLHG